MPLDRFVLILVVVIAAAGVTVALGTWIAASVSVPLGWAGVIPVVLVLYVAWRVLAERLSNRDDDHYDRIEK
jgi:membrane protein implicated in regulation of membrane protease activity